MADRITSGQRSALMSRIKNRDTAPERVVRSFIHKSGFRYRVCVRQLPGAPDIVFSRKRKIIFVHGCFWHQHKGCARAKRPKSSLEFWNTKLDRNVLRDRTVLRKLRNSGWRCLIIWECEVKKSPRKIQMNIVRFLKAT